jgi:hypothetical protein
MQFRLPHAGCGIPCFKLRDTEVYLVVRRTLCSFTGLQVLPLKTLTADIHCCNGSSYFSLAEETSLRLDGERQDGDRSYCFKGTLYCSYNIGTADHLEIEA